MHNFVATICPATYQASESVYSFFNSIRKAHVHWTDIACITLWYTRLNCSREEANITRQDDITTLTDNLARLHIYPIFQLHRPEQTSCSRSFCTFWPVTTKKIRSNKQGGGMVYNPSTHVMSIQTLESFLWSRRTIILLRHYVNATAVSTCQHKPDINEEGT